MWTFVWHFCICFNINLIFKVSTVFYSILKMNNFIFFFNYCLTVTIMHNNATIIKNDLTRKVFPCHKTTMKALLASILVVLLYQRKVFINDGMSFTVIFNFSTFNNAISNF